MELLNIFSQFSEWAAGGATVVVVGVIVTIIRKKGINLKKILGRASDITEEIGEAFLATSNALEQADAAIKDNGRLIESSVKDVIKAGKIAKLEWEDVIMEIKPKKK
jgi:hypothetical protein